MTPTAPPRRMPAAAAWVATVAGLFLVAAAIGLAILLYAVLKPAAPLPAFVPLVLGDIGLLGAIYTAGGIQALRTGRISPFIRIAIFALSFAFIGLCFASLR